MTRFAKLGLKAIFSDVRVGDIHAFSQLDKGLTPLVSCKTEKTPDHGVEGYYDIPYEQTCENCVTITCDGDQPSTAFLHPYRFAAMDNVLVCVPKSGIKLTTILYFISYLNNQRWRFSYGRKCYQNKATKLLVSFPVKDSGEIDENYIEKILNHVSIKDFLPSKKTIVKENIEMKLAFIPITTFFELQSGDFHNASLLAEGDIPLVSCGENFNGIIGFCKVPEDKIYENTLTVAYNGQPLTTNLHLYKFAAKDDVAICLPRKAWKLTTLVYLQYMLNREKWRYSYGRKCFNEKLKQISLMMPVDDNSEVDEDTIERIVINTSYWHRLQSVANHLKN